MKIFKYAIPVYSNTFNLALPEGSKILSCQNQNHQITIWVMFDPLVLIKKMYKFKIMTTGEDFKLNEKLGLYIGTVQIASFVWHLFLDEIV